MNAPQSMPIRFTLPRTFDPMEFLPERMALYADHARYLLSIIHTKLARGRVDGDGYVRLHAEYLRVVMGRRHEKAIVQALVEGGAVRRAPYVRGEKSYGYTIGQRYAADQHVRVPATNPVLIARLQEQHRAAETERKSRLLPVHRHLARIQRRLEIDHDEAAEILHRLPPESNPYDVQGILVDDIENRHFRLSVSKWGRVANNVTSLKRELRKTLHVEGDRLTSVDIACCQPALIALLMTLEHPPAELKGTPSYTGYHACAPFCSPPDLLRFRQLVSDGLLYEHLQEILRERDHEFTREQLKRRFLCDVIAKKGRYPSVVEDTFRGAFPTIATFISRVNQAGRRHQNLIRWLQRTEAWLVIETVCQRFAEQHPRTFLVTLHDAIYCRPGHVGVVMDTFSAVFAELHFEMQLKVAG
jgi:hypothetical protein